MISFLAMVLMAPPDVVTPYRALLAAHREPRHEQATFETSEVRQSSLSGLRVIRVSGWSSDGHHPLPMVHFAVDAKRVRVVLPEFENLDENGYRRRLTALWLCPPDLEVRLVEAGQALELDRMKRLEEERTTSCESALKLLAAAPKDEASLTLLLTLALESPVTVVDAQRRKKLDARLQALLDSKAPGPTPGDFSWVGAPVAFQPWTFAAGKSAISAKGMIVAGRFGLELLTVEASSAKTIELTTQLVGWARQFIE